MSEGSREIEAASKWLAATRARVVSASQRLKSALAIEATVKANTSLARAEAAASNEEAKKAESHLKDAEKRWEVIDVDARSNELQAKKRARVSSSPVAAKVSNGSTAIGRFEINQSMTSRLEHPTVNLDALLAGYEHTSRGAPPAPTALASMPRNSFLNSKTSSISTQRASLSPACPQPNGREKTNDRVNFPDAIQVEGGGCESEVHGIYNKTDQYEDGIPIYYKSGEWQGKAVNFVLVGHECRIRLDKVYWTIGTRPAEKGIAAGDGWLIDTDLYFNVTTGTKKIPQDDWTISYKSGAPNPAPKCRPCH